CSGRPATRLPSRRIRTSLEPSRRAMVHTSGRPAWRRLLARAVLLGVAACNETEPSLTGPGQATKLVFTVQPGTATAGTAISPAVLVAIQDASGRVVTAATNVVTVAIETNPGGGTLSGPATASLTPVKGLVILSDLSVNKEGTGNTLAATTDGLTAATSVAFDSLPPLSFVTVAAGGSGSGSHTCGVTTTGDIYCWGFNGRGQLGDNTQAIRYVPTLVQAPPGVTFQTVTAGGQHTCAVASTGDAYCWGRNEFGRLGDGTFTDRTAPVRVAAPAGVTFASVSAGTGHSCALATGGAVYCWGSNYYGQLGDGSGADQNTPSLVQAPAGVTFTALTT